MLAGNIWIHLIPLLVIVGGIATSWLPVWPGRPWEFFQNIAPIAVCYAGSVTYHTMMAHHEKYQTWITLDVSTQTHIHGLVEPCIFDAGSVCGRAGKLSLDSCWRCMHALYVMPSSTSVVGRSAASSCCSWAERRSSCGGAHSC